MRCLFQESSAWQKRANPGVPIEAARDVQTAPFERLDATNRR
jgi:hypothetical protein